MRGTDAQVGGDIKITGSDGAQEVSMGQSDQTVTVGGKATIDLRTGLDSFATHGDVAITGALLIKNAESVLPEWSFAVTGAARIETTEAALDTLVTLPDAHFEKGFTFKGAGGEDDVTFTQPPNFADSTITGNVSVDLGDAPAGSDQHVSLDNVEISGKVTAKAGSGTHLVNAIAADIDEALAINLGDGTNNSTIGGAIGGRSIQYAGGAGIDIVDLRMSAPAAKVTLKTKARSDLVQVTPAAVLALLIADLGPDPDSFLSLITLPPGSKVVGVP